MPERLWRERNPPNSIGGNVNCTDIVENSKEIPQKLKIELPYDLAIPLLGIYLEKTIPQKDTCTPVFTLVLFTIAKT